VLARFACFSVLQPPAPSHVPGVIIYTVVHGPCQAWFPRFLQVDGGKEVAATKPERALSCQSMSYLIRRSTRFFGPRLGNLRSQGRRWSSICCGGRYRWRGLTARLPIISRWMQGCFRPMAGGSGSPRRWPSSWRRDWPTSAGARSASIVGSVPTQSSRIDGDWRRGPRCCKSSRPSGEGCGNEH
jgi:hypothetical protein